MFKKMLKIHHTIHFILIFIFTSCGQSSLYISTLGNDANPGSIDKPFASFEKAQQEARKKTGNITIYLRAGIYYLDRTVIFTSEDSRGQNETTTYRAFPNEKVIISGATRLKLQWEDHEDGIKRAKINKTIEFDQLFINGKLQRMARYPNYNMDSQYYGGTSKNAISEERVAKWRNPQGGFVHALHKHEWGGYQYSIQGKDEHGALILNGGFQNNRKMGMHPDHRFVENIFEELDTIGEWYYHREERFLYYYPPADLDLQLAKIEVPQLKHLIEFRGSEKGPVQNITIKGVELIHTTRTFMENKEPLLRSDWTIYRGGAILFEGAEQCIIKNCNIHSLGSNAIFFSNYNQHNEVSGNHIFNIGASGICFVGDPKAVRSPSFEYHEFIPLEDLDKIPGPKNNNYPARNLVRDNLIHDIGRIEKQTAGVQISMSQFITVSHNTIYNLPRAGINISEGTWGGHLIEYNDVFNTVLETGDHGSFNSWGRDRFWHPNYDTLCTLTMKHPELIRLDPIVTTVIRNNRFRCDHGWDIDLDDGSTNYHIYNNLCLNGGIKLREGFFRKVENNIMINNTFHPHVWFENSGDVFIRNIVTRPYAPIRLKGWGKLIDFNLLPDSNSLDKAHQAGTDQHSMYGNPGFKDPASGNFQVEESSSAAELGFVNFSMDSFGVLSTGLKDLALKVPLPKYLAPINTEESHQIVDWMGLTIKNLNTPEERSSTGMSKEAGVLVLDVSSWSKFNGYLNKGDVILSLGGRPTQKVGDLEKNHEMIDKNRVVDMLVFRNQQSQIIRIQN